MINIVTKNIIVKLKINFEKRELFYQKFFIQNQFKLRIF